LEFIIIIIIAVAVLPLISLFNVSVFCICAVFVCPDRPWGPPSLLYEGTGSFPGVKRSGRDVDHPPPSSDEVKERVELYLYSPSGPSWPVLG
jgi:hypothetical protein